MDKRGYEPAYQAALLASSGFLGVLIPPSMTGIVYATASEISISDAWLSTLIPAGGIGLSNALLYKMISFDFLYAGGHAFFQADVLLASAPIKIVLLVGLAAWGYLRKTKVA